MRYFLLLSSILLLSASGCSMLGLDAFEYPSCVDDNDCGRASDDCHVFVCDYETYTCVEEDLDADSDGSNPVRCGGEDCDDSDPYTYFGADELCDGVDNNCDGVPDNVPIDPAQCGSEEEDLPSIDPTLPGTICSPVAVATGSLHSCALYRDGSAACWGGNLLGELGRPGEQLIGAVSVPSLASFDQIVGGRQFTCGRHDGAITCWGARAAIGFSPGPEEGGGSFGPVRGLFGTTLIAAGDTHACAIVEGGELWCWGRSMSGALAGDERGRMESMDPVRIEDVEDAVHVAAGVHLSCAVTADGEVHCWGDNCCGSLGDGAAPRECNPCERPPCGACSDVMAENRARVAQVDDIDNAVQVAAGDRFACALLSDGEGTVACWGDNHYGQLGCDPDSCGDFSAVPRQVAGISGVVQISAGLGAHVCALFESGAVRCWGANQLGQLGNARTSEMETPVAVQGIDDALGISVGEGHSCALRPGHVECWGVGGSRQLGDGRERGLLDGSPRPVSASLLANVVQITGSMWGTCFRLPNLEVRCAGSDHHGELGGDGQPEAPDRLGTPTPAFGRSNVVDQCQGMTHSCVIARPDLDALDMCEADAPSTEPPRTEVHCFGDDMQGQLGDGDGGQGEVAGLDDAVQLACGQHHVCALRANGQVACWGQNIRCQLTTDQPRASVGRCEPEQSDVPVLVERVRGATSIVAGELHTCVTTVEGVFCWGDNLYSQLGRGPQVDETELEEPLPGGETLDDLGLVEGLPEGESIISMAAGGGTTCVVVESGDLYCWGAELAQRPSYAFAEATLVPEVFTAEQVAMAATSACVRLVTGRVQCLGGNAFGELGVANPDGTSYTVDSAAPLDVESVTDARLIGCGDHHCCATRTSGETVCWGSNTEGQLANDAASNDPSPPGSTVDMLD